MPLENITFTLIDNPDDHFITSVRARLQDFNRPLLEIDDEPQFGVSLEDSTGSFQGGAVCTRTGQWLEIDFLWISDSLRGQGIGRALMDTIESRARSEGCRRLCTNTFSFQAKPFYEKCGFKVVYVQKNYPVTSHRYFLEKVLD